MRASRRLPRAILRSASWLTPRSQRTGWLEEWHSELWYVPRKDSLRFCLGAYRDALWVRGNQQDTVDATGISVDSPAACLLFLSVAAAAAFVLGISLPVPEHLARFWHLSARDWPAGCVMSLALTGLLLPVTRLILGGGRTDFLALPWRSRIRYAAFFAAKVALVQPIVFCGVLVVVRVAAPFVSLTVCAYWIAAFRWILMDQRRRCPVCLRLLANPVRIGTSSHTFLDWYGAESICLRGHGLLHMGEAPGGYGCRTRWLGLDRSWRDLFPSPVGGPR